MTADLLYWIVLFPILVTGFLILRFCKEKIRFPRRFLTIIRRRVFQLSDGDSSSIIPENRLVNMFTNNLFLSRIKTMAAMIDPRSSRG